MFIQTDSRRRITLPPESEQTITRSLTDPRPSTVVETAEEAENVAKRWVGEESG